MKLKELKARLMAETEAVDARMIIHMATGLDDVAQIVHADDEVSAESSRQALSLLSLRKDGTPMAYITGEKEFYGLPFHTDSSVLIPRPDTETLVDAALECAAAFSRPRILDLCTGSGAVGTAISHTLSIPVALSDISPQALEIAKENYRRNTGTDADARLGSLFEPWEGESFDIIASNPPYLTESWYEETERDVKKEPRIAFIGGGDDGLDIIRAIVRTSIRHLHEGGYLLIECDYRQMDICANIFHHAGFSYIQIRKDLAGKERVIYGRKGNQ